MPVFVKSVLTIIINVIKIVDAKGIITIKFYRWWTKIFFSERPQFHKIIMSLFALFSTRRSFQRSAVFARSFERTNTRTKLCRDAFTEPIAIHVIGHKNRAAQLDRPNPWAHQATAAETCHTEPPPALLLKGPRNHHVASFSLARNTVHTLDKRSD